MSTPIIRFCGANHFLSNFHLGRVELDGDVYRSVEHAYQAAKTLDPSVRQRIRDERSPLRAKQIGARVLLRPGWDAMRLDVMLDLLLRKFSDPELADLLLATGDAELVESNDWGDRFWGVVDGDGQNALGQLLMTVRAELMGLRRPF